MPFRESRLISVRVASSGANPGKSVRVGSVSVGITAAVLLLSRMVDRNAGQSEGNGRLDPLKEKGGNMDGSLGSSSDSRFDPDTGEPISRRHRVPVGGDASLNRFDPDTGEPISRVARVPPTASAKRDQYSTSEDLYKEPLLHGGRGGGGD